MTRYDPTPAEQLLLFDTEPDAPRRARVRTARPRSRRLVVSVLAIGVATAGVLTGSFAAWTTQSTNPGNSVEAGTLTMSNDKAATAVFAATDVKPGDTGSSTVTVGNSGSIPMSVKLTQSGLAGTGIEASLGLKVHDDTRDWCYWPLPAASGACGPSYGAWNATALNNLALPHTTVVSPWPAGQSHTFTISWQLAASSPNSDQGETGSFDLTWDGIQ